MTLIDQIANAAANHGLEIAIAPLMPDDMPACSASHVVMLAAGPTMFAKFQTGPEATDGKADPLDRWSKRIGAELAEAFDAELALPSDGPPYPPFIRWAYRAEPVWQSRLGMMLHRDRGLWASWRGALLLTLEDAPIHLNSTPNEQSASPCIDCDAPCQSACPVGAFGEVGAGQQESAAYNVPQCVAYLESEAGQQACMQSGCRARLACPVGADYRHKPAQAKFHISAFLRARIAERTV